MTATTHIQLRRDTAANWTAVNPILEDGEAGYETDYQRMKVGDGSSHWSALPYLSGGGSLGSLVDVNTASKTDGSVLYYDGTQAKFLADAITTKITLTDGGNF